MRIALLLAVLFFLLGWHFLPQAGLHMDAALELACLYPCSPRAYAVDLPGGGHVPLMAMSYLGALKAWLYAPLLALFDPPSLWVLRVPFLLIGAGTILLFYRLLQQTFGRRAAVSGALLLAVDASFVLATTYDFGPIALLHFLLLAGMVLLLRFHLTGSLLALSAAFFCFGLGLWHKALFVWMLSGIGMGAVCVFPRQVREALTVRRFALASAALLLGASPLVLYNIETQGGTLRLGDVPGEAASLGHKVHILQRTLDGSIFSGFVTEEAYSDTWKPGPPVPFRLRSNGMPLAVAVAVVPALWRLPKPTLFALIAMLVAWIQMAVVGKTGATLHHVILLWPFPHLLVAMALSLIPQRAVAGGLLALGVSANVWMLHQYSADLTSHGTSAVWTDAVHPLADRVRRMAAPQVYVTDWGYISSLCLLSEGRLPLRDLTGVLQSPQPHDVAFARHAIGTPGAIFIEHSANAEQVAGIHRRLQTLALQSGYRREIIETIADRNGRPRFHITRFIPDLTGTTHSLLRTGDPAHAAFLDGFHEIEEGSWRWTGKTFAATFAPQKTDSLLRVQLYVPDVVIERLGAVRLSARHGESAIVSRVIDQPGEIELTGHVPAAAPTGKPVTIEFKLDKALAPIAPDTRELGVIVHSLELSAR